MLLFYINQITTKFSPIFHPKENTSYSQSSVLVLKYRFKGGQIITTTVNKVIKPDNDQNTEFICSSVNAIIVAMELAGTRSAATRETNNSTVFDDSSLSCFHKEWLCSSSIKVLSSISDRRAWLQKYPYSFSANGYVDIWAILYCRLKLEMRSYKAPLRL